MRIARISRATYYLTVNISKLLSPSPYHPPEQSAECYFKNFRQCRGTSSELYYYITGLYWFYTSTCVPVFLFLLWFSRKLLPRASFSYLPHNNSNTNNNNFTDDIFFVLRLQTVINVAGKGRKTVWFILCTTYII